MKESEKSETGKVMLQDKFSRTISYLRLSVTDRCNLRCLYCMPCESGSEGKSLPVYRNLRHRDLLTYEELVRVVRIAVAQGMTKLRLTGGEPLVRKGVLNFITSLADIEGLEQIRLTTNGVLLKENGQQLYNKGIRFLNISLDTLQSDKFLRITGKDYFYKVIDGIDEAIRIGFTLKLNIVAMKGINDNEFEDFAKMAIDRGIQVRFIEFMPIGKGSIWNKNQYIGAEDIKKMLENSFQFESLNRNKIDGPARMYTIHNSQGDSGRVGFISPISHHFCEKCNRLRLTSDGKLRACLLDDSDTDLKTIIRKGGSDDDVAQAIRHTILSKPEKHGLKKGDGKDGEPACHSQMSRIGG